eukprot:4405304-Pleurochrysis_carterae.AAC.1
MNIAIPLDSNTRPPLLSRPPTQLQLLATPHEYRHSSRFDYKTTIALTSPHKILSFLSLITHEHQFVEKAPPLQSTLPRFLGLAQSGARSSSFTKDRLRSLLDQRNSSLTKLKADSDKSELIQRTESVFVTAKRWLAERPKDCGGETSLILTESCSALPILARRRGQNRPRKECGDSGARTGRRQNRCRAQAAAALGKKPARDPRRKRSSQVVKKCIVAKMTKHDQLC